MDIFLASRADSGLFRHNPGTLGDAFIDRDKTTGLPVVRGNMAAAGTVWALFWLGDGCNDSELYGAIGLYGSNVLGVCKYSRIGPDSARFGLRCSRPSPTSK